MSRTIDCNFDGGNIRCLALPKTGPIRLEIVADEGGAFYQWFYFRLRGAAGEDCVLRIENAAGATYPEGWKGYRAVASEDGEDWLRVATDYDGRVLTIRHRPAGDEVRFAYFAPYPMARHASLIARVGRSPLVAARRLGTTLDGAPLDLLEVGGPRDRTCWIIGRQHPGETMAEWWMEGFLDGLLDPFDAAARTLLEEARFCVVPNMNPDGSSRGHLRTNAAGVNLNRAWAAPSMKESPEVYLVGAEMARTGVDFCLDVHGDEALPYAFIAGPEGIPSYTHALAQKQARFQDALATANPEFQTKHGYPPTPPGKANLGICANYVAETYGCLAMTLEQPFKDAANAPDPRHGWSPTHCRRLGRGCVEALAAVIDTLR